MREQRGSRIGVTHERASGLHCGGRSDSPSPTTTPAAASPTTSASPAMLTAASLRAQSPASPASGTASSPTAGGRPPEDHARDRASLGDSPDARVASLRRHRPSRLPPVRRRLAGGAARQGRAQGLPQAALQAPLVPGRRLRQRPAENVSQRVCLPALWQYFSR